MAQQYQPTYNQPPVKQGNGFGVTALVLGIIAVVVAFIPVLGFLAFVLGPLAIIFGIVGALQKRRPKGMAFTGLGLGLLAIILAAIVTTAFFSAISSATEDGGASAQPAESSAPEGGEPAAPAAEAMVVDAATLITDFDSNEAAADAKYAGQILEVTGSVSKVDTEILDDSKYVVRLDDGSEFSFASVNCNDVPTDQAAAAVPDSTVTIRGTFEDGGDLGIELKDCVVL